LDYTAHHRTKLYTQFVSDIGFKCPDEIGKLALANIYIPGNVMQKSHNADVLNTRLYACLTISRHKYYFYT